MKHESLVMRDEQECVLTSLPPDSKSSKHSDSEVTKPTRVKDHPSAIPDKTNRKRHTASSKYCWSPGHYVPNSFALSMNALDLDNLVPQQSQRRSIHERSLQNQTIDSKMKKFKSISLKAQAKQALSQFFSVAKRNLPCDQSKSKRPIKHLQARPKKSSTKSTDVSKPTISYPMKLHNQDLNFVTTQDPWEASVRSVSLRRRATTATSKGQTRSNSVKSSKHSTCQSARVHNRDSTRDNYRTSATSTVNAKMASSPRPPSRVVEDCVSQSTSDTSRQKRDHHNALDTHRLSLHNHPPLRLSLTSPSSLLPPGVVLAQNSINESASRRAALLSVGTASNHPNRKSWASGRPILDSQSSRHSRSSILSEKSSVMTAATDSKSMASCRLPVITDWAGVIEEDVTVTLMGCPRSSMTSKISPTTAETSPTPSLTPISPSPDLDSTRVDVSRPLSLVFPAIGDFIEEQETENSENNKSDWYSDLMNTIERSISKI